MELSQCAKIVTFHSTVAGAVGAQHIQTPHLLAQVSFVQISGCFGVMTEQ